jgi:hypothetical protein
MRRENENLCPEEKKRMTEIQDNTRAATLRAVNPTWAKVLAGLDWLPRSPEEVEAEAAILCVLARCRRRRRCCGATPEVRDLYLPAAAGA